MDKFNKLYKMIMEDKTQEVNNKIFDYIDNGQNFDDLPYQEQRQIIQTMDQNVKVYGEEAKGLYQNVNQFSLYSLLKQFDKQLFKKYSEDDWGFDNSRKYANQLKNKNVITNQYAYYSNVKGEQTWQDVAEEVWEYYEV